MGSNNLLGALGVVRDAPADEIRRRKKKKKVKWNAWEKKNWNPASFMYLALSDSPEILK